MEEMDVSFTQLHVFGIVFDVLALLLGGPKSVEDFFVLVLDTVTLLLDTIRASCNLIASISTFIR